MPHFRLVWINEDHTVAEATTIYHETYDQALADCDRLGLRYQNGYYVVQEDDDLGNFPPAREVL